MFPFPSPLLLGPASDGPYGSHRYWRVNVTTNAGSTSPFVAVTEIELRETAAGADVTGSGTAISGGLGSDAAGQEAAKAFDGTNAEWARAQTGGVWIGYDFGAGNAKAIAEVALTGSSSVYDRSPATGTVDYSDDGSSWTTAFAFDLKAWVRTATRILPEVAPAAGYHRCWRVFVDSSVGGAEVLINELEFRATPSGADQTTNVGNNTTSTSGRIVFSAQGAGNEAYKAFDGVLTGSTGWFVGSSGTNQYVGYIFPDAVAVQEVTVTGSTNTARSPSSLHIQSSDDAVTWTNERAASGLTWTSLETKTFSVP